MVLSSLGVASLQVEAWEMALHQGVVKLQVEASFQVEGVVTFQGVAYGELELVQRNQLGMLQLLKTIKN